MVAKEIFRGRPRIEVKPHLRCLFDNKSSVLHQRVVCLVHRANPLVLVTRRLTHTRPPLHNIPVFDLALLTKLDPYGSAESVDVSLETSGQCQESLATKPQLVGIDSIPLTIPKLNINRYCCDQVQGNSRQFCERCCHKNLSARRD